MPAEVEQNLICAETAISFKIIYLKIVPKGDPKVLLPCLCLLDPLILKK